MLGTAVTCSTRTSLGTSLGGSWGADRDPLLVNRELRAHIGSLQQRRHFVPRLEAALCTENEAGFGASFGVSRHLFCAVAVRTKHLLATSGSASLPEYFKMALFLAHLHKNPTPFDKDNPRIDFGVNDPLWSKVIQEVGCAVREAIYERTDKFDLVSLAFERVFGSSWTKIHAALPKETHIRNLHNTASLNALLLLPDSFAHHPSIAKALPHLAIPDSFIWRPSVLTHPIFSERAFQNLRLINRRASYVEENEILETFLPLLEARYKRIEEGSFAPVATTQFPEEDAWGRRIRVGQDVFAWVWAELYVALTPADASEPALYYSSESKLYIFFFFLMACEQSGDAIKNLRLEVGASVPMDELVAVCMQVRDALAGHIYFTQRAKHPYALAMEGAFGKFSYIHDMIPHRLEIPRIVPREEPLPTRESRDHSTNALQIPLPTVNTATSAPSAKRAASSSRPRTTTATTATTATKATASKRARTMGASNSDPAPPVAPRRDATERERGRRASFMPRRPPSSSPPSAIKDIRNWRPLLAREGDVLDLADSDAIVAPSLTARKDREGGAVAGESDEGEEDEIEEDVRRMEEEEEEDEEEEGEGGEEEEEDESQEE
ncbi:hypothetical protein BC830DRAFT_650952 [Chytriomyces sp. MP71]|nr:hypothetical protein BC830DRAFT_650952 [Chytriomyces sp. MP71]